MLKSMTGFGMGQASARGLQVEVEVGSVNRKQFDARISLPRTLAALEPRVREVVQEKISRGQVTVTVRVGAGEGARPEGVSVDRALAKAFLRELRRTAAELNLRDDLTASALLRLPEVILSRHATDDSEQVWAVLRRALAQALKGLTAMRAAEGKTLASDLTARLRKLQAYAKVLNAQAPDVPQRYREKLRERLREAGLQGATLDEALLREIVVFADRADISEELVRLDSHFGQTAKRLTSRQPAGRALDFLCQEMFREINTIGSKANDASISAEVIRFKTELESIREQVQNIE